MNRNCVPKQIKKSMINAFIPSNITRHHGIGKRINSTSSIFSDFVKIANAGFQYRKNQATPKKRPWIMIKKATPSKRAPNSRTAKTNIARNKSLGSANLEIYSRSSGVRFGFTLRISFPAFCINDERARTGQSSAGPRLRTCGIPRQTWPPDTFLPARSGCSGRRSMLAAGTRKPRPG